MESMRIRTPLDFGIALQQARLSRGMSQQQFAEMLDLPQATISQMENGQSTIFVRRLLAMMSALDMTLEATWKQDADATTRG